MVSFHQQWVISIFPLCIFTHIGHQHLRFYVHMYISKLSSIVIIYEVELDRGGEGFIFSKWRIFILGIQVVLRLFRGNRRKVFREKSSVSLYHRQSHKEFKVKSSRQEQPQENTTWNILVVLLTAHVVIERPASNVVIYLDGLILRWMLLACQLFHIK